MNIVEKPKPQQQGQIVNFHPGVDAAYRLVDSVQFGAQMRERRTKMNLTLSKLGASVQMTHGTNLGKIERGVQNIVSARIAERLVAIASILGMPQPRFVPVSWSEVSKEAHARKAARKAAEQESRREERRLARLARAEEKTPVPAPPPATVTPISPAPPVQQSVFAPPSRDQVGYTLIRLISSGQVDPITGLEILRLALTTPHDK